MEVRFTKGSLILAITLLFLLPQSLQSANDVTLEVSNAFLNAGNSQILHASIVPHYQNTSLCFGIDSERFSSQSCRQLEGQNSPKFHESTFKNLPSGQYIAYVLLFRSPDRLAAQVLREFIVN